MSLAVLLVGCGTSPGSAPTRDGAAETQPVTEASAPEATAEEEAQSQHGWTAAEPGDEVSISSTSGDEIATINLQEFKPVNCDSTVFPGAENGQVIAATVNVELSSDDLASDIGQMISNATAWRAYDAEGQRVNSLSSNAIYNCLTNRNSMLPMDLSAGESATGDVLLDIPENVQSIAWVYPTEEIGFEWPYAE